VNEAFGIADPAVRGPFNSTAVGKPHIGTEYFLRRLAAEIDAGSNRLHKGRFQNLVLNGHGCHCLPGGTGLSLRSRMAEGDRGLSKSSDTGEKKLDAGRMVSRLFTAVLHHTETRWGNRAWGLAGLCNFSWGAITHGTDLRFQRKRATAQTVPHRKLPKRQGGTTLKPKAQQKAGEKKSERAAKTATD